MLEVSGCSVRFGGVQALRDVSLSVREGEIVGIVGPNGAGKTTLFDVISGFRRPDEGTVRYRGRDVTRLPAHARAAAGIARTFQNLGLVRGATVRTNLLAAQHLAAGYSAPAGILGLPATYDSEARLSRRAAALADMLGLSALMDRNVDELPYGVFKRVEVAAALATDADLVLLDEPTSGMGPSERTAFAAALAEFRRTFRVTVAMIEHDVPLVAQVCDYVYCLNFGQLLAEGEPDALRSHPDVIRAYLGDEVPVRLMPSSEPRRPFLEVDGLWVAYGERGRGVPVLRGLSFQVGHLERMVLLGLNGAGKTTTVATLAGLLRPQRGSIVLDGADITATAAADRVGLGITLVPEGRQVFSGLSVDDNLRIGAWARRRDARSLADGVDRVKRVFPHLADRGRQLAGTLSGGEQQMLAIGRALMAEPRLLLVDEASLGLSPAITQTVFSTLDRINGEGVTVVLVEQGMAALDHADRVMILERGELVFQGSSTETDHVALRDRYLGAPVPV